MRKKSVERYCKSANKTTQQLYKVSTPYIDGHHFKEEELTSVGELSQVCSQIVLKCLHLARIGRPDILWSVNKFARWITKWTKACDKRLKTSVSHSSTESEIISLDAGLRLDEIPALDLWNLIVAVLGNTNQNRTEQDDLLKNKRVACSPPHTTHKRKQSQRLINDLENVDYIPSNVHSSDHEALLYVF